MNPSPTTPPPADSPMDLNVLHETATRFPAPHTPLPPLRQVTSRAWPDVEVDYRKLTSGPLVESPVWIDGIQRLQPIRWVRHRPIYLGYASAGAVEGRDSYIAGSITDELFLGCSEIDAAWLVPQLHPKLVVRVVSDGDADTITGAVLAALRQERARCEKQVVADALDRCPGAVVVDGPLSGYAPHERLVGVVKTHGGVAYLDPERHLHELTAEHMTSPFPIGHDDAGDTRWAAYVRLHPHMHAGPFHSLIRLEAFGAHQLEPLARTCLGLRQHWTSGDARWHVHLETMAACERFLNANVPKLIQLLRRR